MKRAALILSALMCMASRHPDRMIRSDLVLNCSYNRGDATDRSWNARNGTLTNGAVVTAGNRWLTTDGVNDCVEHADDADYDFGGDFTVSAWVKRNGNPAAAGVIAAKYSSGSEADYNGWILYVTTAGKVAMDGRVSPGGFISGPVSSAAVTDNAWHHACFVRSGSTWTVYIDGASSASSTLASGSLANNAPVAVGMYKTSAGTTGLPLAADIDDLGLYNRALSAAEVAAIYSSGRE